jgi:hypothetical protein
MAINTGLLDLSCRVPIVLLCLANRVRHRYCVTTSVIVFLSSRAELGAVEGPRFVPSDSSNFLYSRREFRAEGTTVATDSQAERKFRIEGSGAMLEALRQAISVALRQARATPHRTGAGRTMANGVGIEVAATTTHDDLKYVITSIDDAVSTIAGWAEVKRCTECGELVALLFDDAYLETADENGVICCDCFRRSEADTSS